MQHGQHKSIGSTFVVKQMHITLLTVCKHFKAWVADDPTTLTLSHMRVCQDNPYNRKGKTSSHHQGKQLVVADHITTLSH